MGLSHLHAAIAITCACSGSPGQPEQSELTTTAVSPTQSEHVALRIRNDLTIDGHVFALWEKSAPNARGVVVLVHGRTWSSVPDFDLQVPGEDHSLMDALVRKGYTTFALDQRGYGATPRDATGWLTPDRAATDLAEVLRWVRTRSGQTPALLGWSYGSLVSQLCAQRNPDLISDLILYGYPRGVSSSYAPGPEAGSPPARSATTAAAAAEDFIAKGAASPAMIEAFVKTALASDPIRADWRDLDQFAALDARQLRVPTLLMHGEHDPYAPQEKQAQVFADIATADKRWAILPGGDHAAHLESTGPLFVHSVVEFLGRPKAR